MKRTAERCVFVESLTAIPTRLAEVIRATDPRGAADLDHFASGGRTLATGMLASVHGERFAQLPTAKIVGD